MIEEFELRFPATSANLGPAFDSAALALDFYLWVRARRAAASSLIATGRDAAVCGARDRHLIIETYEQILQAAGKSPLPLALQLENHIPIGKGCGSSAAARLAGVALAVHFGALGWTAQKIFEAGAELEGHPDNAAACWWGGLTVAQASASGETRWLRVPVAAAWPLLVVVPEQPLPTAEARGVLPTQYARSEVVANLQNAVLLLHAVAQGRSDLLAAAMQDHLHQPYRAALCPMLPALQPLVGVAGILGCALSGAGPSVLLIVRSQAERPAAITAVEAALGAANLSAEILPAAVEPAGASVGTSAYFHLGR